MNSNYIIVFCILLLIGVVGIAIMLKKNRKKKMEQNADSEGSWNKFFEDTFKSGFVDRLANVYREKFTNKGSLADNNAIKKQDLSDADKKWVNGQIEEHKTALLNFYVNDEKRNQMQLLSLESIEQLEKRYGQSYNEPFFKIFDAYKQKYPAYNENLLVNYLQYWLDKYLKENKYSVDSAPVSVQITYALRQEVQPKARKIVERKLTKQKKS